MNNNWIPVTERLPETDDNGFVRVMIRLVGGFIATTDYIDGQFDFWADNGEVIAWRPLPEPYKGE